MDPESLDTIAAQLSRLQRIRDRTAAQLGTWTKDGIDPAAFGALMRLCCDGPMRSGELAAVLHSDASTVSRQVAQLVAQHLVERQADPDDGRATVLVVTERGRMVAERIRKRRNENLTRVMSEWTPQSVADFAALLRQFVDDFERARPEMVAAMRRNWDQAFSETENDT
ncbi:MarR family winged helix-turn-helix transcriptional regulator [Nocardia sp. NPDC049149]|uniref:MarR family winged helix-turn-helix transcriptional regulator n=1 Tax=Nocardia sp. NPDC049149 TaxID=3364315 RepID=UPI0037152D5B